MTIPCYNGKRYLQANYYSDRVLCAIGQRIKKVAYSLKKFLKISPCRSAAAFFAVKETSDWMSLFYDPV